MTRLRGSPSFYGVVADRSGSDVLARLCTDPRTKRIPVVILGADATPGRIKRFLEQGAHDYLRRNAAGERNGAEASTSAPSQITAPESSPDPSGAYRR